MYYFIRQITCSWQAYIKSMGLQSSVFKQGQNVPFSEQPVWKLAFFLMLRLVRMNCRSGRTHLESGSLNGIRTRCVF